MHSLSHPTLLARPRWTARALGALCASLAAFSAAHAGCMGMELHAHRGAPGYPENSRSAVEAAVRGGWDGAEIDVQTLADNDLAVHHDLLTTRTTSLKGRAVRQLPSTAWSEVRLRDRNGKLTNEAAPFLRDLLPAVQRSGKVLNVEIKEEFRSCMSADSAVNQLRAQLPSGQWTISSTEFAHLKCVRKLDTQAYLGAVATDKVSMALSDKRTASRAHLLKSPDINPQLLARLQREVGAPVGLHVDIFSLRANPNLFADAAAIRMPVFTYSLRGDADHAESLRRLLRERRMLPSGAIIDGDPRSFCDRIAS